MSDIQTIEKKIKLTLTPANIILGLVLIAIAVLHFVKPDAVGQAETFVLFALTACGVQVTPWFARTEQAIEKLPTKSDFKAPPPGGTIVALFFVIGVAGSVGIELAPVSCSPAVQQDVVNTITPATACVLNIIGDVTGNVDIAKTAATCGVTAADIYQIVKDLMAGMPDATADAALGASPARVEHLRAWLEAADKARAAK